MQSRNNLNINKLEIKKDRGDIYNRRTKPKNSLHKKDDQSALIRDKGDLVTNTDKDKIIERKEFSGYLEEDTKDRVTVNPKPFEVNRKKAKPNEANSNDKTGLAFNDTSHSKTNKHKKEMKKSLDTSDSINAKVEDSIKQANGFIRKDDKNIDEGGLNITKHKLATKIVKPNDDFKRKTFEKFNSFDATPKSTNHNETKSKNPKSSPHSDVILITDKGDIKSVNNEVILKNARKNEVPNKKNPRNDEVVKRNIVESGNTISGDKKIENVVSKPKPEKRPVIRTVVAKNDATKVFKSVTFTEEKTKLITPLRIKIPPMKYNHDADSIKQNNNQNLSLNTDKNKKPKTLPDNNDTLKIDGTTPKVKNYMYSRNRTDPNLSNKKEPFPQINDNALKVSHNTEVHIKNMRREKDPKASQTDGDVKNLSNKKYGDVSLRNRKEPNLRNKRDPIFPQINDNVLKVSNNTEGDIINMRNGKVNLSNKRNGDVSLRNKKYSKVQRMDGDVKRKVINLARNMREPKVPQSNDTESKTSASGKSRATKEKRKRPKKHRSPLSLFTENGSPPTEVAKWAPDCVTKHTQRYYEAWVDTTLAAVSRGARQDQHLIKSLRRIIQRPPPSPELIHENYLDERYTGRIKVNHRQ